MDETESSHSTRPLNTTQAWLRNKFDEEFVNQAQRLDEIAKQLITVELAVPGLYATALKMISGDNGTLVLGLAVYGAFVFWAFALLLILAALLPRSYIVDRDIIRRTPPDEFAQPLSVEAFFKKSANYKYRCIVFSCACFFLGVSAAVYSLVR